MYVVALDSSDESPEAVDRQISALVARSPTWMAVYGAEDSPFDRVLGALRHYCPSVPVFGATSFSGVFTPNGFVRQACLLVGEATDGIKIAVSLQRTNASLAKECARKASLTISSQLGTPPKMLLLHAIPGFEERILEGVNLAYGKNVPVFGGSATDDHMRGGARVFSGSTLAQEGFVLVGISSPRDLQGAFTGGFLPSEHSGVVNKAEGRVVYEIDGKPAAERYNEWTSGAIAQQLRMGGSVVSPTAMSPLSRTVGSTRGMQRRILSHPDEVLLPSRALRFFTEFSVQDQVTLMTGTSEPLVARVSSTVKRARGFQARQPNGALLVYCAGSLAAMRDQADRICREFGEALGGAPFLGIATAGEQGTFFANSPGLHGNLMCCTVLF
jgi:hypothetical protein